MINQCESCGVISPTAICKSCIDESNRGLLIIGVEEYDKKPVFTGHQWVISRNLAAKVFDANILDVPSIRMSIRDAKELGLCTDKGEC